MAKHDIKAHEIQVEILNNLIGKILAKVNLTYGADRALEQFDLVYRGYVDAIAESIGAGDQQETVIADLGTLNNLAIPTSFARFTGQGQVILTGVAIGDLEGKSLLIRNETGQELTVVHEGVSSDAENRFYISVNNDSLPLGAGCAAWFKYSLSQARWQLVDTWGNGYSPHLVGEGERVVVANADGSTDDRDTFLFEENRDDITEFPDKATLDTLYPDAPEGFRVYCKNIFGGGVVFRKHDEVTGAWGYQMYTELT